MCEVRGEVVKKIVIFGLEFFGYSFSYIRLMIESLLGVKECKEYVIYVELCVKLEVVC